MTDQNIQDQAYQFFQQESVELLQVLEEGLLNIQVQYDTPHIHQLMRAAHSIKGGASSVGLPGIQKIAHKLEDIIRALYHREEPIDDDLEEALLQALDCLRLPLMEQLEVGFYDEVAAWEKADPIFTLLEALLQKDLDAVDFELPTSAELGIDLISEVFSSDVCQAIERLESIIQHPEGCEITGEIRAMSEVLVGIGDLLDLNGLSAIAQATLNALETNPNQTLDIARATLDCLNASRTAVEAGDRREGGSPSPTLLALAGSTTITDHPIIETFPEDRNGILPAVTFENLVAVDTTDQQTSSPEETQHQIFDDVWEQDPLEESLSDPGEFDDLGTKGNLEDIFGQAPAEDESVSVDIGLELNLVGVSDNLPVENIETIDPPLGLISEIEPTEIPQSDTSALSLTSEAYTDESKLEVLEVETPQKTQAASIRTSDQSQSVRVDFNRLERLNNLAGELVTQENGTLLQSQQIQKKLKILNQRFRNFEQLSTTLKDWMDKSLQSEVKNQNKYRQSATHRANIDNLSELSEFDPLQMDSYNESYTVLQEALNEIAQMGESLGDIDLFFQTSQQIHRQKQQTLKQVRDDLLWARMIPLSDILKRFPRMVRDMATKHKKHITYKQIGASTLVDKGMLERLYDPLVHLVRNAFDHGTETPEERILAGKPKQATIEIRAYHRGNQTFIEIHDDGRGIDPEGLRSAIVKKQLLDAEAATQLLPEQLYPYIFQPSFSTAAEVNELSGRGMGLSTVQTQVQLLKGSVRIMSEVGRGTTFTIALPLTLTIAKLLIFSVDSQTIAIPVDTLQAIITANDSEIFSIQGGLFYRYRDKLVPLYPSSAFAYQYPLPKTLVGKERSTSLLQEGKVKLLLISNGDNLLALEVDQIYDEQELAIKPFGKSATPPPYLFGCALIGDGTLVPVVDGAVILSKWNDTGKADTQAIPRQSPKLPETKTPIHRSISTILVIDDSLTIRQNVTLTLQKHGYQVIQAGDGREALAVLSQNPQVNAVITDVEMPTMNGFEFLSACRKIYPADVLPIVMLTSRSSDKHRGIAKVLGANHYLTKPYLEQDLLASIKTLLEPINARDKK